MLPKPWSKQEDQLIDQLLAELYSKPADAVVAYRGSHRWVPAFESLRINDKNKGAERLRRGGVYLIAGGLGGIGLVLAEYLATTFQAKLIRSEIDTAVGGMVAYLGPAFHAVDVAAAGNAAHWRGRQS